jgi:predicted permease
MISLLLTALVPVAFVVLLGFYAGRKGLVSEDGARNFSAYIVDFALPCTLFVGVFSFTPAQFTNVPYLATITLALVVPFVVGLGIAMFGYKKSRPESGLFACNCGFPDMAYFGLPVLMTVVGAQGLLPVIVGNLVTSILLVPCIVLLLNHKASGNDASPSLLSSLLGTVKQPVVWAPVLGLVLMLMGFRLPPLIADSLKLIGGTTGGGCALYSGCVAVVSEIRDRFRDDHRGCLEELPHARIGPWSVLASPSEWAARAGCHHRRGLPCRHPRRNVLGQVPGRPEDGSC